MHTVVLISDDTSIDKNLLNSLETLFPECRVEIVNLEKQNNHFVVAEDRKYNSICPKPSNYK